MRKTSHPDDASELSTYGRSRKRRKYDEVSVGGILSDYLLPYNSYGENHPKQRDFEENIVALVAHAFTSLSLMDHDCLRKLTQDIDSHLHPVGK